MNFRILLIMLVLTVSFGAAERPSEIPLWPQGAPGSEGKLMNEAVTTSASGELSVSGIHNPSITPYLPAKDKATGLAILVIPGGGHRVLAITPVGRCAVRTGVTATASRAGRRERQ